MVIQNLKQVAREVNEILGMDEKKLLDLMAQHPWAVDHLATSKDDIEEVKNFLMTKKTVITPGMTDSNIEEKAKFTKQYDNDPTLKGKQKGLPDQLQKAIINKRK